MREKIEYFLYAAAAATGGHPLCVVLSQPDAAEVLLVTGPWPVSSETRGKRVFGQQGSFEPLDCRRGPQTNINYGHEHVSLSVIIKASPQ